MKRIGVFLICLPLTLTACQTTKVIDVLSDSDTSVTEPTDGVPSNLPAEENDPEETTDVLPTTQTYPSGVMTTTPSRTTVRPATVFSGTKATRTRASRVTSTFAPFTTTRLTTSPTAATKKTYSANQALKIACVGDSITRNGYWQNNLQGTLNRKHTVAGFGVNGATALTEGLDNGNPMAYIHQLEYRQSLNFAPDIVVIMLGTNDSKPYNWNDTTADQFIYDCIALVQSYQTLKSAPSVFIALPPTAFTSFASISNDNIENAIIPALKKVAEKTGARIIDTHAANTDQRANFSDGVHPSSAAGRKVLAQAVSDAINAIIH